MGDENIKIDDTKKPELNEIATVEKDIYMDYIGRTLINPDKTLKTEGSGKGIELYEDLLRDPEIRQAMQTRRLAVVGREWEIIPGSEKSADIKIAEFIKEVLLSCNFDNGRKALLSAIVLGFKSAEIMWEYSEGSIWINRFIGKPSRRFTFDVDNNLRLLTFKNMIEGEAVPSRKFQVFAWGSDNGSPFGYGLGSSLYWMDWFAKNTLKFWMIFADKFGSPTAVGKYPNGTTTEQQGKLLSAIETIQTEAAIAIPDTMVIELLEAARQGSMDTYERLCNYLDKKKTKLILGQTLTSDVGDKGSYAASKTHDEVRKEFVKADADELCEALNDQVIKWLVDYNFPNVQRYPKIWIRTEDEDDLKPLAERDKLLVEIGVPITKKYFYDTYGIPEPQEGEEIVTVGAGLVPARIATNEFAEGKTFPDQTAVDNLNDSFTPEQLQAQLNGVLKPVIDLVKNGESYEAIMEKLSMSYPDMDSDAVEQMLSRAIFITELWGRINA
ncbi:MAG: DUF935 family protein [Nitrospirae bacterium]|nr:DUF935 family protein [Nitrospirota bacterium]